MSVKIIIKRILLLFGIFLMLQILATETTLINNFFANGNEAEFNENSCIPYIINYTAYDFETMEQKLKPNQYVLIQAYMNNCQTNTPFAVFTKVFHDGELFRETWITGIQSINPPDPDYWWTGLIDSSFVPDKDGVYEVEISIVDDIINRNKLSPEARFFLLVGDVPQEELKKIENSKTTELENVVVEESPKRNIPQWVKNTAKWFGNGSITAFEFVNALQYLITQEIIIIPDISSFETTVSEYEQQVPEWVRNAAGWYGEDIISEDEFVSAIQYLIEKGIIRV